MPADTSLKLAPAATKSHGRWQMIGGAFGEAFDLDRQGRNVVGAKEELIFDFLICFRYSYFLICSIPHSACRIWLLNARVFYRYR
jgi:hypothetical protein